MTWQDTKLNLQKLLRMQACVVIGVLGRRRRGLEFVLVERYGDLNWGVGFKFPKDFKASLDFYMLLDLESGWVLSMRRVWGFDSEAG